MTPPKIPQANSNTGRVLLVVFLVLVVGAASLVYTIASTFRLGPETAVLAKSARPAGANHLQKRLALNLGATTFGLVRFAGCIPSLPPEARAAMKTVRSAEVGVFQLSSGTKEKDLDRTAILSRADTAMSRKGWDRIVGVIKDREVVAIYTPRRSTNPRKLTFCLLVCKEQELVVARVSGDPQPLLELAAAELAKGNSLLAKARLESEKFVPLGTDVASSR